jgi:hypothetical protein
MATMLLSSTSALSSTGDVCHRDIVSRAALRMLQCSSEYGHTARVCLPVGAQ